MTPHAAGLVLFLAVAGCATPGPVPLVLGEDRCDRCHMTVADPRFGGELLTSRGRMLRFDDAGCLLEYVVEESAAAEPRAVWVVDYLDPGRLLPADEAVFLQSDALLTPMHHAIAAMRPGDSADSLRALLGGELVRWPEAVARVIDGRAP